MLFGLREIFGCSTAYGHLGKKLLEVQYPIIAIQPRLEMIEGLRKDTRTQAYTHSAATILAM